MKTIATKDIGTLWQRFKAEKDAATFARKILGIELNESQKQIYKIITLGRCKPANENQPAIETTDSGISPSLIIVDECTDLDFEQLIK